MMKTLAAATLTAAQLTEVNRHLALALIGVRDKNRLHIEKALEILNGTNIVLDNHLVCSLLEPVLDKIVENCAKQPLSDELLNWDYSFFDLYKTKNSQE